MSAEAGKRSRPLVRARVAVPLALLAAASLAVYLIFGMTRSGPFGPLLSPPPIDWTPPAASEVTLWAWQGGMDHYRNGAFEEASSLLGRAAAGTPNHPQPAFFAGVCHLLRDRPEPAVELLQRAVDLSPQEPQYLYYLAWAEWNSEDAVAARGHLDRAAGGDDRWSRRARKARSRLPR